MANESEMERQLQQSANDGLANPDANFENDSAIDPNGLTNSELLAIQKQTQDELDGQAVIDNEVSGIEDEDDEDVIDVDNPEDLARKGLRKI